MLNIVALKAMKTILIADSGSTKCDWVLITPEKYLTFSTVGLNPYHIHETQFSDEIKQHLLGDPSFISPDAIYFFGAGCAASQKQAEMKRWIEHIFPTAHIEVDTDLMAACLALCTHMAGVVGILGTGSNICYYNGEKIEKNPISLGYLLGDEGSGNHIGRLFLQKFLRRQFSTPLQHLLEEAVNTAPSEIIRQVYESSSARYMASFLPLLKNFTEHPEIEKLFFHAWDLFYDNNVVYVLPDPSTPLHFTGSVAYHFQPLLKKWIEKKKLILGNIIHKPIHALANYYKKEIL